MKIGELAAATGCHFETIRYYEKVGLLPKPLRTASGYRAYRPEDVARVRFVTRGRELGFSLEEVRSLIRLSESPDLTCEEVDALARHHLEEVQEKLRQLQRMEAELLATIDRCHADRRADCAILQALGDARAPAERPGAIPDVHAVRERRSGRRQW